MKPTAKPSYADRVGRWGSAMSRHRFPAKAWPKYRTCVLNRLIPLMVLAAGVGYWIGVRGSSPRPLSLDCRVAAGHGCYWARVSFAAHAAMVRLIRTRAE